MRRTLSITSVIVILLIGGCQTSSKKDFIEFPSSRAISFKEVSIPEVLVFPGEIIIQNDMLIVLDMHSDWFFKFFSLPDLAYLGSLVRQGRGPEEEIEISPFFRTYEKEAILYQGANSVKISRIKSSHNGLGLEVMEEYELPASMNEDTDIFLLNGNLYSSFSYMPSTRDFHGYCLATGQTFEWGALFPLKTTGVPDQHIPMLFQKTTTVKPDRQLLAIVYGLLPIIRIYSAESGNLLAEKLLADPSKNALIMQDYTAGKTHKGLINYHFRVKSTNDYIYTLYSGQSPMHFLTEGGGPGMIDLASEIHIWKWDGTPVMKLELERPVFSFDVTPDNKTIIASSIVDVDRFFRAEIPWD